jgi:MtN3 and saliva related transmembrane protein
MISFTYIDIIGIIAGLLIIISFIPQLITIIKNRSSRDISIIMYFLLLVAQILWMVYGILKSDLQIIMTNAITSFLTILIIGFSLYFNSYH